MHAMSLLSGTVLASFVFVTGLTVASIPIESGQPNAELAVRQLQSDFHEATALGDYALLLGLWAEDAVFSNPAVTIVGRREIADWFAAGAGFGGMISMAPTYKSTYDVHGNRAEYAFECVIANPSGLDPLTTPLSSIPFGAQNPSVEIVQHSNASGTMVRRGNRWVFLTFNGAAGPIQP
jgi:hypothetical protein